MFYNDVKGSRTEPFEKMIDRSAADEFTQNMSQFYRSEISDELMLDSGFKWRK